MSDDDEPRKPITIAQAWSAPIVICAACVAWAVRGIAVRPEASHVYAVLVIMIVGPVTATALIARGIVGIYQRHRWQGCVAIICGVVLFAAAVAALGVLPSRGVIGAW